VDLFRPSRPNGPDLKQTKAACCILKVFGMLEMINNNTKNNNTGFSLVFSTTSKRAF